jgi:phage repressor protein C with HTH and peptisase S24 domain
MDTSSENTRTIVVNGNSMLPLYRHGDTLIVAEVDTIKAGDRAVIQTHDDRTMGGTIIHKTNEFVALKLGGLKGGNILVEISQVKFLGRILWASQ